MNIFFLTIFNLLAISIFAILIKFDYLEMLLSKIGNLRVKKYAAVHIEKSKSQELL